jgi:hypothetical protein
MEYALFALGGVILTLIGLLLFRAQRRQEPDPEQIEQPTRLTPQAQLYKLQKSDKFWGVSVESHCGASSRLAGQHFPFDEAPHLPVNDCNAAACICSYIGLPDRRMRDERRRGQDRRGAMRMESTERRADRPRRKDDLINWNSYRHF